MTADAAEDGTDAPSSVPFISRVRIKNYKSIASCDVRLGPLTILGGLGSLSFARSAFCAGGVGRRAS
ncbi:MAG: hypothetical protein JWM19_5029 [Actinomycetia bacterium]|nr:hypothetical protein [Actinomycetes bacterium]